MRWILVVIPLVLIGIIGMEESFGYGGGGGGGKEPDPRVCGDRLCSEISGGREAWESSSDFFGQSLKVTDEITDVEAVCLVAILDTVVIGKVPSPRMQIFCDIEPETIRCNEGLQLIFKTSDNSPVCVKPETAEKLIQRGWAIGENGHGYFKPQYLPIRITEAYENSLEPTKPVCVPEQIEMTRMDNPVEFNFPTVLPAKYKLEMITDIDPNYGLVRMIYTFGECGKDTTLTAVQNGGLQIYVQDIEVKIRDKAHYDPTYEDEALVQQELDKIRSEWESAPIRYDPENVHPTKYVITVDGQEEIQEFKHESTFRTINGHVAKIIEPGYTTEQYWDYNADQFLYAEVVQHPGQISFYSEDFRTFYSIKGFFSADELFQIAKSIE